MTKSKLTIVLFVWAMVMVCAASMPIFVAHASQNPATPTGEAGPKVQIGLRGDELQDGNRIDLKLEAGESITSKVFVANFGQDPIELVVYTADVGTQANGGPIVPEVGSEQHEPTTWLEFPTETITVTPQAEAEKGFTLSIPDDAAPGQYAFAFAAETAEAVPVPGTRFMQKTRKILLMYVTVPGKAETQFELGAPITTSESGAAILVPLNNLGQTILRLQGEITVEDNSGDTTLRTSLTLAPVYGMAETYVLLPLSGMPPAGEYRVTLSLTDSESGVTNGFENAPMTVEEPAEALPLSFTNVQIGPNADPIQFLGVAVDIVNTSDVIQSARLSLVVTKDGQPLEEFILADNLKLNQGTTSVSQRYIPLDSWESGSTYEFSLKLESVDSSGGTALLLEQNDITTVEVM